MDLKGKIAVVTGGATRLGKEFALMLAKEGAEVIITYHSSREAIRTLAEIRTYSRGIAIQCDISDYYDVQRMSEHVVTEFGYIDILINNASHFEAMPCPDDGRGAWERTIGVSVNGPFYVFTALAPIFPSGVIVNVLDGSIWRPWKHFFAHAVGKSAMEAMTRQWALELAPRIRSNAVCLGPILPSAGQSKVSQNALADNTLLKRWGTPQDASDAVKFLIQSEYITGEILTVDGGERWQG